MKLQSRILVGKKNSHGGYEKVCTGKLYEVGATFPKISTMTDDEHEEISAAARWLHECKEDGTKSVDLQSGYRVSLYSEQHSTR